MAARVHREGRYRFSGFEVDASALELRAPDGALVALPPLAFDLMLHLIEHRERVVSKDELFDALWSDVTTSDNSLSQAVWAVRRALGDTGGAQRVIKNVRGRGYRFVSDVLVLDGAAPPSAEPTLKPQAIHSCTPPTLVGREHELDQLLAALAQARAGSGRIARLSAAPGLGKTRLTEELCARARRHGVRVYEGRCVEGDSMPPFWPLQQVARALVRDFPPERLHELVGDAAGDLVKLIPELREGLPDLTFTPERDLAQERFAVFDALQGLFARAAAHGPLVIALDDLHWADEATLLCLEFLAPSVARMPLLLLCAHREDLSRPALQRCLGALDRQGSGQVLQLSGLAESHAGALLALHGALHGGRALDPALVRRVYELTAGNPFMVIQVARWLVSRPPEQKPDGDTPLALPPQALALVAQQIAALPAQCQALLRACAVLSVPFHLSDVRRASELTSEVVLDRLEPALRGRLVREAGVGSYDFTHPTIRSAIYDGMPRAERAQLHERAARAIAEANSDDPSSRLGELAHHYYQAAARGCEELAVRYCTLAAKRAYEATAYEEAAAHYRRALAALELLPRPDERQRCNLLLGLGQSLRGTPEPIQSIKDVFADVARRARVVDDAHLLCEAAMCHAGRGPRRVDALSEVGTVDLADIALLEQALGRVGPEPSADRALVEAWLARALYHSDRASEMRALAHDAVATARQVGDLAVLAECLMLRQSSVRGPDDLDERFAALDEIIELARRSGLRGLQLDAHDERAWARLERGDIEGTQLEVQSIVRLVEELHQPAERRTLAAWRIQRLDDEGRFDEARRVFEEAQAAAPWKRSGDRLDQGSAIRDFMVALFMGRSHEIIPGLEAYAEKFPLPVAWHCGLVSVYAAVGRAADARRELDRLAVGGFACFPNDHNWLVSHALLANAARLLDDPRHAPLLYERLSRYPDRTILVGLHAFNAGPMQRALGELALVQGQLDLAETHLRLAIERASQTGMLIWAAWCRLLYTETLLRRGERDDQTRAFEHLTTALHFARERGLVFLIDWGQRLRERGVGGLRSASMRSN